MNAEALNISSATNIIANYAKDRSLTAAELEMIFEIGWVGILEKFPESDPLVEKLLSWSKARFPNA